MLVNAFADASEICVDGGSKKKEEESKKEEELKEEEDESKRAEEKSVCKPAFSFLAWPSQ